MKSRIPEPLGPPPASACADDSSAWNGPESMRGPSAGARHRLESRQRFDACQPASCRGIRLQGNVAFWSMRNVGVAGQVGDGRMLGGQILSVREMSFHETQEAGGDLVGFAAIGRVTPECGDAGRGWTVLQFSGGD